MKFLFTLILIFSVLGTYAQQGDDSTKYIYYKYQYGQRMQRYWADYALHIPFLDTTDVKPEKPGAIMICSCDTLFYKWDGFGWQSTGGGTWGSITGTLSSQTDLQAALDAKVDTTAFKDSLLSVLNNLFITARIEFEQVGNSATYQNDSLINANLTMLTVETDQLGFTPRSYVYISDFDTVTGTITLTNGYFADTDHVIILYRAAPIFLTDANGWPVKISGQYVILN